MATEIKIIKTGYQMTEAKIVEWWKAEGDKVNEGETLVTLDTQKVAIELPAPCSGILLKILAERDETVVLGQTIAIIAEAGEDISEILQRIDREKGASSLQDHTMEDRGGTIPIAADEEVIPLTGPRKAMAEHMLKSKNTYAHGTTFNEVDVSGLLGLVKESNKEISFTSLLVRASVHALQEFPLLNTSSSKENIIVKKRYHIGIAVNTEGSLVVPVVRDADQKDLKEITREIQRLTKSAEEGRLSIEDIDGGTFTISNGGRFGSLFFVPIINPPQSAILGTGTITKRPVVVDDKIVIRPMMYICVSYDHRIIPGAMAQQFLGKIKEALENG